MKTKILALLVAAMITFNISYAGTTYNDVNETVLTSFSQQFEKASDVQWTKASGYNKVTFTWNDQYLTAFYDDKGASIAVARNITQKDLPILLQTGLADEYKGYWISDLFEYTSNEGNKFYITVENANKKIILESMDYSSWEVFKKTGKE